MDNAHNEPSIESIDGRAMYMRLNQVMASNDTFDMARVVDAHASKYRDCFCRIINIPDEGPFRDVVTRLLPNGLEVGSYAISPTMVALIQSCRTGGVSIYFGFQVRTKNTGREIQGIIDSCLYINTGIIVSSDGCVESRNISVDDLTSEQILKDIYPFLIS